MSNTTQCEMILESLLAGNGLTQLDAYDQFGCVRLAARINDLRKNGHPIITKMVTNENRFGRKVTFAKYTYAQPTTKTTEFYHGCPADRGSADAWYSIPADPHKYPNGTYHDPLITDLTDQEREEYMTAYNNQTERKDWG